MPSPATKQLADLGALARLLEGLADERRLRIVALLSHGELCVCHFEAALSMPQPDVSRQLSVLRRAGVLTARRERSWVYYRLAEQAEPICREQLRHLVAAFGKREQLQRDVERLIRSRGPASCK